MQRVGRQPLRKLSRHERFIGPASMAAERGLPTVALVRAVAAALDFDDAEDEQSVELQQQLGSLGSAEFVTAVTGLDPEHPLFTSIRDVVAARQEAIRAT